MDKDEEIRNLSNRIIELQNKIFHLKSWVFILAIMLVALYLEGFFV